MKAFGLLICFWAILGSTLWAQNVVSSSLPISGGLTFETIFSNRGMGVDLTYLKGNIDRFWTFGVGVRQVKDLHEARISPFIQDRGRRYVFGKLNSLTAVNLMVGRDWNIMPRSSLNAINVRLGAKLGPTIGLLNPYYLVVCRNTGQTCELNVEPYDPDLHTFNNIYGRAGLSQSPFTPDVEMGFSAETYALVDLGRNDHYLSGLKLALHADGFLNRVPLLVETEDLRNRRIYLAASVAILFGTRW